MGPSLPLSPPTRRWPARFFPGSGRWLVLVLPTLSVVIYDVVLRHTRMDHFTAGEWGRYLVSCGQSAGVWGLLLLAFGRGPARLLSGTLFGVFFTIAMGGQLYFFQQFSAYLNRHVSQFATNFGESVVNQLVSDAGNYFGFNLPALCLSLLLLAAAKRCPVGQLPSKNVLGAALVGLLASFFLPQQAERKQTSLPDMLYMEAMGEMFKTQLGFGTNSFKQRPGERHSKRLPRLTPRPKAPRNVVLVVLESVRKDATCSVGEQACQKTKFTHRAFPTRTSLSQLRALDSCTVVSMGVLYGGIGPQASRASLHNAPFLFDYARAAGYQTAFFTSQNLLFGNMHLWLKNLGVDLFLSASDVDPAAHLDMGADEQLFTDRAIQLAEQLKPPYFLTIQLSNGHYPYWVREDRERPFRPASTSKAPEDNAAFFNHYQNAVYQQDEQLTRLLLALRSLPGGQRTVIVYTSDHGEAFREHGQMGHTASLYDEEVLVPGFIDAPEGTLSALESDYLQRNREQFVFHPDLTVTVLDLIGVWDDRALDPLRAPILGRSLLRPLDERRIFPMTNCSEVWSCAFENWGAMQGSFKLQAREWDESYRCFDVAHDPKEEQTLPSGSCPALRQQARVWFPRFPGRGRDASDED